MTLAIIQDMRREIEALETLQKADCLTPAKFNTLLQRLSGHVETVESYLDFAAPDDLQAAAVKRAVAKMKEALGPDADVVVIQPVYSAEQIRRLPPTARLTKPGFFVVDGDLR